MNMKVTQTIQSVDPFNTGTVAPPVELTFYNGDSHAQAIAAVASATADAENGDRFYRVLSVRIVFGEVEN